MILLTQTGFSAAQYGIYRACETAGGFALAWFSGRWFDGRRSIAVLNGLSIALVGFLLALAAVLAPGHFGAGASAFSVGSTVAVTAGALSAGGLSQQLSLSTVIAISAAGFATTALVFPLRRAPCLNT
jgi:hypothetical protein